MNAWELKGKSFRLKILIMISAILAEYLILNVIGVKNLGAFLANWFQPLFWLAAGAAVLLSPKARFLVKNRYKNSFLRWSFALGLFYVSALIIAGLFNGFGRSPYNFTFKGILFNLISVSGILIGRELVRGFFVSNFPGRKKIVLFFILALFMSVIEISPSRFLDLSSLQDTVIFFAKYFAPGFCLNLMATYLVYLCGPLSSIIYLGAILAFQWFSPILPNLSWLTTALVGILCPIFSLIFIRDLFREQSKDRRGRRGEEENPVAFLITAIVAIGIIWFSVGVFPVYPTIIATGSMSPVIKPGDVVLVHKIQAAEQLKVGEIIQFRRDEMLISHRIADVIDNNGVISYQTKGDANPGPDIENVEFTAIKGVVTNVIPKIGVPALLFKDINQ